MLKFKNKKNEGTTLVELMIYMIVALIVITAAFNVISHAASGYVRGRTVATAQYSARDGLMAIARDVASMGYKVYFDPELNWDIGGVTSDPRIVGAGRLSQSPDNTSALFLADGGTGASDTLEFFRIRVDKDGIRTARERIRYWLDDEKKLVVREFWSTTPPAPANFDAWGTPDTTFIASNVVALNFRFSATGIDDEWIDAFDPIPTIKGNEIRRNNIRHVEVAMLVEGNKREKGAGDSHNINIGNMVFTTPAIDANGRNFIYRLYRQSVEVPNNGRTLNL